ncbi:hypothetical protein L1987_29393 [Smallanthus sonchifolius]|uniref:Uncharacterized protein n=1 Tax=Smallanthus sonchifolius TaxID=185202 RepID=A0ACB9HZY2_9ASTR|nr:hypothetical protein L1987_29393 [Smallanthus sonchifolius]
MMMSHKWGCTVEQLSPPCLKPLTCCVFVPPSRLTFSQSEEDVVPMWCNPAIYEVHRSYGDEQAIAEASAKLQILENKLTGSGKKFFGGDNINLVDIVAVYIAYWPEIVEEAKGIKFYTRDKFPKITEWADNFLNCQVVKETLPPRAHLLDLFLNRHRVRCNGTPK